MAYCRQPGMLWNSNGQNISLCGLVGDVKNRGEGLFRLENGDGMKTTAQMEQRIFQSEQDHTLFQWKCDDMEVTSEFSCDRVTGIWSRRDRIINGNSPQTLQGAVSRFLLEGGDYEIYTQFSGWQTENQGVWQPLNAGELTLTNWGIRSTEAAAPILMVRDKNTRKGVAFQLFPIGNWIIRISPKIDRAGNSYVRIETGLSDRRLALKLSPDEEIVLPELLIYAIQDDGRQDMERLHSFLLSRSLSPRPMPLLYNTWFCDFDRIDLEELRRQLKAVKEIGCELFVIDAGWFGEHAGWWKEVGYWQEQTERAFYGKLAAFTDELHKEGLLAGLWMEPERVGENARLLQEHPEWLRKLNEGFFIIDLENPEAFSYLFGEICRLIDTYHLDMMKLDFNMGEEYDPTGSNFYRYYIYLFRLMRMLRERYPLVYFENCSSGGTRSDLSMAKWYDSHFISDTANPAEVLHISQGLMNRFLPGIVGKWTVVRQSDGIVRRYGDDSTSSRCMACGDAEWGLLYETDLDFSVLCSIMGAWGISTDIAGLSEENRQRLRYWSDFYHKNRQEILHAVCCPHTQEKSKGDREAPVILEYDADKKIWLIVYRLEGKQNDFQVFPKHLEPDAIYEIEYNGEKIEKKGSILIETGIFLDLPRRYSAKMIQISRKDS